MVNPLVKQCMNFYQKVVHHDERKKNKINIHVFFGGEILLKYYERI